MPAYNIIFYASNQYGELLETNVQLGEFEYGHVFSKDDIVVLDGAMLDKLHAKFPDVTSQLYVRQIQHFVPQSQMPNVILVNNKKQI